MQIRKILLFLYLLYNFLYFKSIKTFDKKILEKRKNCTVIKNQLKKS